MLRFINLPDELYIPRALSADRLVGLLGGHPSKQLMAVGLDESIHWRVTLEQACQFGDIFDGGIWLFDPLAIVRVADDGTQTHRELLRLDKHERIGCLTATVDGLLVSVYRDKDHAQHGLAPRVLRLNAKYEEMWSTRLPVNSIAYRGCVRMGVDTHWEVEESPPWNPSTWLPCGDDQLLISGNRILASFQEMPRSGIGCRYVLDADTGDLVWKSKPSPIANARSLGEGTFLMGDQGYGAFKTTRFEDGVSDLQTWPSHGHDLVVGDELISVQMSNDRSVPQHLVCLKPDGTVHHRSERLPGYYSSKPLLLDGDMVFWRSGHLWNWNPREGLRSVAEMGLDEGAYASSLRFTMNRIGFNVRPGYARKESHRRLFALLEG